MNKKRAPQKVLVPLDLGYTIREVRQFKEEKGKRIQTGSYIALFKGKKEVQGGFKNVIEARGFFNDSR